MHHRRRSALALLAAALLLAPLSACTADRGSGGGAMPELDRSTSEVAPGGEVSGETAPDVGASGASDTASAEQSVIHTGDVSIEVSDPARAADEVAEIAEDLEGRVESRTVDRASGENPASATLTVRIPAERLDAAFEAFESVGTLVSQSRSATDVTLEHVDLQARVAALEESVERLTELMAGAATTGELIEAESALSQRQQELDGLRAQLSSLEGQVEDASVQVSLSTTRSALPGGPANFWEGLLAGLESLASAGAAALVIAGILLPWIALGGLIALIIVLIVRSAGRRRARGSAPGTDPAPEPASSTPPRAE